MTKWPSEWVTKQISKGSSKYYEIKRCNPLVWGNMTVWWRQCWDRGWWSSNTKVAMSKFWNSISCKHVNLQLWKSCQKTPQMILSWLHQILTICAFPSPYKYNYMTIYYYYHFGSIITPDIEKRGVAELQVSTISHRWCADLHFQTHPGLWHSGFELQFRSPGILCETPGPGEMQPKSECLGWPWVLDPGVELTCVHGGTVAQAQQSCSLGRLDQLPVWYCHPWQQCSALHSHQHQ